MLVYIQGWIFLYIFFLTFYLFYNDYETSYTTYINHARWHRCLPLDGLCVGGTRIGGLDLLQYRNKIQPLVS